MSELASDCALHHTRVMFRISRHVTVNVQLLAECGELDTKLCAVLDKHTLFQGQILIRVRTAALDGRHYDGCSTSIQKTLQLVGQESGSPKPSSIQRKRRLRALPELCHTCGVQHIQSKIGQLACAPKTSGQLLSELRKRNLRTA